MTTGATLTGSGVGFYLKGDFALLAFALGSTIDLSAPINGPMAGILLWEDKDNSKYLPHVLLTQSAHNLLGTIYIPKGTLTIGSPNAVADQSFFTIIVANRLNIANSPMLTLNSNYAASVVPVPQGLGVTSAGNIALEY